MKLLNLDKQEWGVIILAIVTFLLFFVGLAQSQVLGVNYSWSDSATVNVTGRDSTFTTVWESINLWPKGGDGWVRFAFNSAGDTTNWSSKKWIRLTENQVLSFDAGTKLKRLQFKSATGTTVFYFVGYKKTRQF